MFGLLSTNADNFITITPQWACDIVQEFVYQFQEFCQFRSQVSNRSEEEIAILSANPDAWSFQGISNILKGLVAFFQNGNHTDGSVHKLIGYFAVIESTRLSCLTGDHAAAIRTVSTNLRLFDATELFHQVPACHLNIFYHTAVSMMLVRRYGDAIDVLSSCALHISRVLKPGQSNRITTSNQFQKMLDKILSLVSICTALCPWHAVDDQILDTVHTKLADKIKRLQSGELTTLQEMFENSCPKFVFAGPPDYSRQANYGHEAFSAQVQIFVEEAAQQLSVLKLRTYLRLYSSIDLAKLSRFMDCSEEELQCKLTSYNELQGGQSHLDARSSDLDINNSLPPTSVSDISFVVNGNDLHVQLSSSFKSDGNGRDVNSFFISGTKKNIECASDLNRIFKDHGVGVGI